MKPLTIAFFSETYLPQVNGVVTSTVAFADELRKMGHRVIIICPKTSDAKESTDDVWRFRSIPYPFQKEHRLVSPLSRKLKTFKTTGVDIIHIQTPFSMGHLGQYLSWKHRIPLIHTYHTYWDKYLHYFPLLPKTLGKKANLLLFTTKFCNRCSHVIVPSSQMKSQLIDDGVTVPLDVIPTGIRTQTARPASELSAFKREHHIPDAAPTLIFVGRLGIEKNIYFLLDVFHAILTRLPDAVLLIVGDGPEKDKMATYAKTKGFEKQLVMTGYIPHDNVTLAYECSDVILFPSKTETQGLSLLEGLNVGKPAVCLKEMGVCDLLGPSEEGGFFAKEDVADFSEKAVRLLSDESLYQQKCIDAKRRARMFSSEKMTLKLLDVYYSVLSRKDQQRVQKGA